MKVSTAWALGRRQSGGDNPILLMGNHGVLGAAQSIAQAFDYLYYFFERACETYITLPQARRA